MVATPGRAPGREMRDVLQAGALAVIFIFAAGTAAARTSPDGRCMLVSGNAAATCVKAYTKAVSACRDRADAACETALHAAGGTLDGLLAATAGPTRRACSAASADKLTFSFGLDDFVFRTAQACEKWAEDFVALAYADDLAALSPAARVCQRRVADQLGRLRDKVVVAYGRKCYVSQFAGDACDRPRRDALVAKALAAARASIIKPCGATFDDLGLSTGATLDERVGALADTVAGRARHLAQRVYPPLDLGPTEFFGPFPVGVRTLDLLDASRSNVTGTGSRPVKVEIYYPSTAAAVAGLPLDVLHVLGIDIAVAPTYRDVASAPGVFPVVLYSTGSGDPRYENQTLAVHLASYGFLVAAAEHHGNDLLDPSGDPDTATNRPRDMSFLLDQLLDFNAMPEHFLEGAIDGTRIGATGFSLGGYTAMALATGPFHLGAFADPRVKAILPLDGATWPFIPEFPSALSTITVPTLLLGGTQSPLAPLLPLAFDALLPGPAVMAYGNLIDAGHGTFDDVCGVPEAIVGVVPECQPDHVPWHYARHIMNYLALNFFDATLNGNAEALARLDPAVLANIEELTYQSK